MNRTKRKPMHVTMAAAARAQAQAERDLAWLDDVAAGRAGWSSRRWAGVCGRAGVECTAGILALLVAVRRNAGQPRCVAEVRALARENARIARVNEVIAANRGRRR